jgi:predicted negative regulator of RcsB-dependent stress response
MRVNQKGFSHDVLLVVLVVFAVIGFAGYRVWSNGQSKATPAANTATTQSTLTSASKELDQMGNELDANLDDSALNVDLDSM